MGDLEPGDLLLLDGAQGEAEVLAVAWERAEDEPFTTYNLEVADWHTYSVALKNSPPGSAAVWVHITGGLCANGISAGRKLIARSGADESR